MSELMIKELIFHVSILLIGIVWAVLILRTYKKSKNKVLTKSKKRCQKLN